MNDLELKLQEVLNLSLVEQQETKFAMSGSNNDAAAVDKLAFADPNDLIVMQKYLGLTPEQMLDQQNIESMKMIQFLASKADLPTYQFLIRMGNMIGGRMSERFSEKIYTYLKLLFETGDPVGEAYRISGKRKGVVYKQLKKEIGFGEVRI